MFTKEQIQQFNPLEMEIVFYCRKFKEKGVYDGY